jgi:hypothetical protein
MKKLLLALTLLLPISANAQEVAPVVKDTCPSGKLIYRRHVDSLAEGETIMMYNPVTWVHSKNDPLEVVVVFKSPGEAAVILKDIQKNYDGVFEWIRCYVEPINNNNNPPGPVPPIK